MTAVRASRPVLVALLALAVVPYFLGLGDAAIWDANEAFYVETPREMLESGDYLNPRFNYEPRYNKPPLSYWIVAALYQMFGASVATERLGIALGAVLLIVTAFVLAREVFGADAGLIAALAMATAPRLLMWARRIFIDIWVTMFMAASLMFFVLAERRAARRRVYLALMYVAIGLGVMTKGPVAIVLPGLTCLAYLAAYRRLADLRQLMLPVGAVIVLLIVVPWYAVLYAQHGWTHIHEFFITENLARYTAPYGAARRGPLFYAPVVLTDMFPWSLYLPVAALVFARHAWMRRSESDDQAAVTRKLRVLLLLWIVVIVGFFTLSETKQDLYIFPTTVAIAALVAGLVAGSGVDGPPPALVRWNTAFLGAVLLGVGFAVLFLFSSPARVYALNGADTVGWAAIVGGVIVAALAWRRRQMAAVLAVAVTLVFVNWVFVLQALPSFERYKPVPAMAEVVRELAEPGAAVGYYKIGLPSLAYYTRRHVFESFDPNELVKTFSAGRDVYCVVTANDYEEVRRELPVPTCVITRSLLFDVKIGSVLAREPPPELLLITNRCDVVR